MIKSIFLALALSLSATTGLAMECVSDSNLIDYAKMQKEGGEETLSVYYLNGEQDRFLVFENKNNTIIAMKDADLEPLEAGRGVILTLDQNKQGHLAIIGHVIPVSCN